MQGLGYKEVVEYLKKEITKEEMIEKIKKEVDYALLRYPLVGS
jgi:tRNA A37 N6-isopentenylltransferase MiaA